MASVNPTPHTNAERMWLSSGRVPLHDCLNYLNYLNVLVWKIRELINQKINRVFVVDINFNDVSEPIDKAKCGFVINDIIRLDKNEAIKFIKTIYTHVGFDIPEDAKILQAIKKSITEFNGRMNTNPFYPKRKYQGHPICKKCGNSMNLETNTGKLYYKCQTPSCNEIIKVEIY